jgi:hypothetical protein
MTEFIEGARPDTERPTPETVTIVRNLARDVFGQDNSGFIQVGDTVLSARENRLQRTTSLLLVTVPSDTTEATSYSGRQIHFRRNEVTYGVVPCVKDPSGLFVATEARPRIILPTATQGDMVAFLKDTHHIVPIIRTDDERIEDHAYIKEVERLTDRRLGDDPDLEGTKAIATWTSTDGDVVQVIESAQESLLTFEQMTIDGRRQYVVNQKRKSITVSDREQGQEVYGEGHRATTDDRETLLKLLTK